MARYKKKEKPHVPPANAVMLEQTISREELIMTLTSKMPDLYEDLDELKRKSVDMTLESLNNGVCLRDACKAAGHSDVTFYRYRQRYAWIQEAMETINAARMQVVEDALFQSAVGYDYETSEKRIEQTVDADGNTSGEKKQVMSKKKVHVQPVVTAQIFWLKNRSRGHWRNDHQIEISSTHTDRRELSIEVAVKKMVEATSTEDLRLLLQIGERAADEMRLADGEGEE